MYQSAESYLRTFLSEHEGAVRHMYLDNVGWITTGIGNKIDPIGDALSIAWDRPDGSTASNAEVTDAWNTVDAQRTAEKGQPQGGIALEGGNSADMRGLTSIRLSDTALDNLFSRTARGFESTLRNRFPAYDTWPADAQLGLMSMAWALGPNFNYPKFQAAVNENPPDFITAAQESGWGNENPGRRAATTLLFTNAAAVQKVGADPSKLYYPNADIAAGAVAGAGAFVGATVVGLGAAYAAWKFFTS